MAFGSQDVEMRKRLVYSKAIEFIQAVVTEEAKISSEGPSDNSPYKWVTAK